MAKVFLLEDEQTIGRIYQKRLTDAGHKVSWVQTAEAAAEQASLFQADIVLVDHGIRGHEVSGLDILPDLRAALPNAKIVMLSNYSQTDIKEAALQAGCDDYFIKINTRPKELVQCVENLLQR